MLPSYTNSLSPIFPPVLRLYITEIKEWRFHDKNKEGRNERRIEGGIFKGGGEIQIKLP